MTRRYYSSDLTNREWAILAPLIPPPSQAAVPLAGSGGRLWMPSSTCCAVAAPGGCCRMISHLGKRSIITGVCGGGMAHGNGYTRTCASRRAAVLEEK